MYCVILLLLHIVYVSLDIRKIQYCLERLKNKQFIAIIIYSYRIALEKLKFTHNECEVQRPTLLYICLHV